MPHDGLTYASMSSRLDAIKALVERAGDALSDALQDCKAAYLAARDDQGEQFDELAILLLTALAEVQEADTTVMEFALSARKRLQGSADPHSVPPVAESSDDGADVRAGE